MGFSSMKGRLLIIVCVILFLLFLRPAFRPAGNILSPMRVSQMDSDINLTNISYFELKYKSEHDGKWPHEMADLLPYAEGDIDTFYSRYEPASKRPADWSTNKAMLDKYADYRLTHDPTSGVLVYEKLGLWPDGSVGVAFADGKVKRLSGAEFAALGTH